METVILKPFYHRDQECIGIHYPQNPAINQYILKKISAKWSRTNRCWYVPFTEKDYVLLLNELSGKVNLQTSAMDEYFLKNIKIDPQLTVEPPKLLTVKQTQPSALNLSPQNLLQLEKFIQMLQLKAYSPSTIKTYRNEFMQLLKLIKDKAVNTLTEEDIKRYMVYVMQKEKLSENTAHSRLNALKFYFEKVLGREKFFWEIPRPKKPMLLPKLLNETELRNLFNALENKKHKAMLFTAYSAGLRVSEIVNLKIADIDSKRMQILIERAKGKKDRYVNLSPILLDILRNYIKIYKPSPKIYLFESEQTQNSYPTRTVQQIFTNAKNKAGIKKEVGVHSLRHSFATHLLDKGTDIRYIKDLLGHFDIKTTERYLHVSKQKLVNIISPLDDLIQKEGIEW
jgi:site-specific recombinase XerD